MPDTSPPQRIIIRKTGLVLCDLPELPVQTLDDIRRVYDFPDLGRIFKKGTQNFLIVLPALDTGGVLFPPCVTEASQVLFCFLQRHSSVDLLQVGYQLFYILVADVFGGTADLVNDTALQAALGIHRLDRLHHTAQTICTEQINIQNTPAFEVIQHAHPKFAALMLSDPDTEDIFFAVHGDAQNYIMPTEQLEIPRNT